MATEEITVDWQIALLLTKVANEVFYVDTKFKVDKNWIYSDIMTQKGKRTSGAITGNINEKKNRAIIVIRIGQEEFKIYPGFLGTTLREIVRAVYDWREMQIFVGIGNFGTICGNQENYNLPQIKLKLSEAFVKYYFQEIINGGGKFLSRADSGIIKDEKVNRELRRRFRALGY